jgi:DNA gyrase subunit A
VTDDTTAPPADAPESRIEPVDLQVEMQRSYLDYAMSVIVGRALPDVRDGLKPVHRRVLYAMFDGGYRPDRGFSKCSRIVGDVMGQYHPHGDTAIYDTLVRLAQDWSLRYPLVQGQGNFGSRGDDRQAAMRYCVMGDTRVRTYDRGTMRIADLVPDAAPQSDTDIDIKVLDPYGDAVRATKFFHSGSHPTLRLTTRAGFQLTGTRNHPVLCLAPVDGVPTLVWRLLEEIKPGDRVAMSRVMHPEIGDLRDETAGRARKAAANSPGRVPEFVWRSTPAVKIEFLRSLDWQLLSSMIMKSYGRYSAVSLHDHEKTAGGFTYSTMSFQRATDVQQLLLELGIASEVRRSARGAAEVLITTAEDVGVFARNVGARAAQADSLPFTAAHGDTTFYFAEVMVVEDAGIQPVYSIRIDTDDHAFLTDGFISHNTECRLAPLAMEMVRDIDEDTVDFSPNYDGRQLEPDVLPSRFPNLLANGSGGIAVGMATNIPPHNLREIGSGVQWYLEHPEASNEELLMALLERVKGPDFPTGGLIVGTTGIQDAYRTGRGSVIMRAVVEVEEDSRGRTCLVITELPYQVNPDALARKIAELADSGRVPGIADLRDDSSSRTGLRLVVVLKRDAVASVVRNNLFKHTQLQDTFGCNMVALVDGVPRTLSLDGFVRHWVAHQIEVIQRRTRFRLRRAEERAHILRGLVKALDALDDVIALIRRSPDVDAARIGLIQLLEVDELQANAILEMQLRRLAALERQKILDELTEREAEIAGYHAILASEARQRQIIAEELGEIIDRYGDERRARIVAAEGEMSVEDLIAEEDVVVTITRGGYAKRTKIDNYRSQRRGGKGVRGAQLREDDVVEHLFVTTTHHWILFFTNKGRVYRAKAYQLPELARDAKGQHVANLLAFQPDEKIAQVLDLRDYEQSPYLVLATRKGFVKKTRLSDYDSNRAGGVIAITFRDEDDELIGTELVGEHDDLLLVSRKGQALRFTADGEQLRPMGRATTGVTGMRFRRGDELLSMALVRPNAFVFTVTDGGFAKRTPMDEYRRQGRGGLGIKAAKISEERGSLVGALVVDERDEVLAIRSSGGVTRTPVGDVPVTGRDTMGVKFVSLDARDGIVAIARNAEDESTDHVLGTGTIRAEIDQNQQTDSSTERTD